MLISKKTLRLLLLNIIYYNNKHPMEVSRNSSFIQVLIKLCWRLSKLKLCCILFDELAIKENVSYNLEHDDVENLNI